MHAIAAADTIRGNIVNHVLSLGSRRRVHEHVAANPGAHLREIARALELPLGTALYHLDYLTTHGLLVARRDGRYKRFFVANALGRRDKDLVTAFRHVSTRRIAEALLAGRARTQRQLCEAVGVSRSTLSFHLKNMMSQGLVRCEDRWPENHYRVAEPDEVARVLAEHHASFEGLSAPALLGEGPRPATAAD